VRRAGLIAAVALGVVAIAGAAAWLVALRDTAEPVSVEEAVTSFRTETEETSPGGFPITEGVYVYATSGSERTDALTGVTHRYPRRSTITVAAHECGVSLTWRVLKGRSTEWVYCLTPDGLMLARQDERHTFFGRTEQTTYVCQDTPILPGIRPVGFRWNVSCTTGDAKELGTGKVVADVELRIAGSSFGVRHVRKRTRFTGEIRGESTHDLWFHHLLLLPVRIVMVSRTTNDSPIGDVHYEEHVTLRLLSLEPRR
jgi:hypothetical protein